MHQLFPLLIFFNSALHVSGDKFAHPQDHFFDCIYSFWYNAPTLLPTGVTVEMELCSFSTVGALYQKLYTRSVRKVSDRIFLCEHLMDYNLARLHEPTLNLSAHA